MKRLILLIMIYLLLPIGLGISSNDVCITNTTLRSNLTYDDNGEMKYFYTYEECTEGCDTVSNKCYPDPINQNLILLGIVLFIGFLIFVVPKYLGR